MAHGPSAPVHHHAVQFYGNEQSLFRTVAGFLGQGLVDGQPAILIATDAHATGIREQLRSRFIDVDLAERAGDLIVLDAQRTLSQFMIGDVPDPDAFEATVGTLIARLAGHRGNRALIRAYGEMVDVLWKADRFDAAIRLEMLWNKLAARFGFALLCGYCMGNFYKQTDLFEEVCRQHTHVMPTRTAIVTPPGERRIQ